MTEAVQPWALHAWRAPRALYGAAAVLLLALVGLAGAPAARAEDGGKALPPPVVRDVRKGAPAPPSVPPRVAPAPAPRPAPGPAPVRAPRAAPPQPVAPPRAGPAVPPRIVPAPPVVPAPFPPALPSGSVPAPPTAADQAEPPGAAFDAFLEDPGEEDEETLDLTLGGDRPTIVQIEFDGNALFATDSLKVMMQLKEGEPFDPVDLDRDLATLYRFFEKVRVATEEVGGGVILRFLVEENPLVVELNIYGAEEIGVEEVRSLMSTRVGFPLFPYALASDAEDLVEAYRMRGFYFAQVPEPVITTLANGGRRVDFTIVEGPEVEVQKILFRGNTSVSRRDMMEIMETSERGLIPFLSSDTFRMDLLLEDLVAIKRLYESRGFLDAEVVLDDLRFSDDKGRVIITIVVVEHQPYCVGTIDVEIERIEPGEPGAPPPEDIAYFTQERLRTMLGLCPGRRFDGETAEEGIQRIVKAYYGRSYMDADVRPLERRGRERQNVVDVTLRVDEGRKSRLRRLHFVGNEYTRDKVLRREVKVAPGGYIDRAELDRSLARLNGLQYFERVTMQIRDVKCTDGEIVPGYKDVTYEVVEGSTGKLNFGVGISTDGGLLGSISFQKENFDITRWPRSFKELTSRRAFTGAGQTFNVFFAPGTITSQFSVGFTEPHLFGSDLALSLSAYKRLNFREDYDVDIMGYGVGLSYPLLEDDEYRYRLRGEIRWRHENDRVQNVGPSAVPGAFLFRGDNELRSLSAGLTFNTVDDFAKPKWSTRTRLIFQYAGGVLGGDLDFMKFEAGHELDFIAFVDSDGKRHRFSVRGDLGWAEPMPDTPELPPFERFYMGGNRMRGFSFRGAGPHINGEPTGGEWLVLTSAEYLIPIVKDTFGVVGFVDAGTLATTINAQDAGLWRVSVGFGVRIKIPMLGPTPLAFDFGFPLMYEEEDERTLISFALGRDF